MHVLIGDKFYDSSQAPIMILFDANEVSQFKSTPSNVDIFCSWPSSWNKEKADEWVKKNQPRLIASTKIIVVPTEADAKIDELLGKDNKQPLVIDFKGNKS